MRKTIIAILTLAVLLSGPVFARNTSYATGDQVFSFRAGVNFPAFINFFKDSTRETVSFSDTHMKLGGYASISYQGYTSTRLALGGELGYIFNYSNGMKLLTTVPMTAKLTYVPVQTGLFDLALNLNLGGAFVRYDEGKYFSPLAQLTVQPSIFVTESWGLGLEFGLTTTAEIYTLNSEKPKDSAICGVMPLTLTVSYRH